MTRPLPAIDADLATVGDEITAAWTAWLAAQDRYRRLLEERAKLLNSQPQTTG